MCDWTKFFFFWYAKVLTQAFLNDSHILFWRILYVLGCSGPQCPELPERLPRGCLEVAQRLLGGCTEAAQRLHRGCRKVAKRLPRDCPEVTRRLPRGWTKVARSLPRCCPEATWKLPKGLPNRGKRKLIDFCSFISAWSKVWKKTNSVPLVWQTFCKVVGQNSSWKCKVFLLCNTEASRQIMMSWCLQYDLISASMFHHSIFSRQVLTWFLQGILILWEKPLTQVLYK